MARMARPLTQAAQSSVTAQATHSLRSEETSIPNGMNGITLGAELSRWHTHLQASDRIGSQRTIDAYLYGVRFLADSVGSHRPLADVTTEDIEALLGSLKRADKSAGGRAVVFRPIRTFFRWCVARDLLDRSPAERVAAPKAPATPVEFVTDRRVRGHAEDDGASPRDGPPIPPRYDGEAAGRPVTTCIRQVIGAY